MRRGRPAYSFAPSSKHAEGLHLDHLAPAGLEGGVFVKTGSLSLWERAGVRGGVRQETRRPIRATCHDIPWPT